MIPVRLTMRNFLTHADTVVPFEDLASPLVISGRNGAGKSSLMYAITWALWGKTPSRANTDLVRWGADKMEVEYEFDLDGQRYRVRRVFSKSMARKNATASMLVFEERRDGDWKLIGEEGLERTQAEIDRRILEYRLFVTSVYLAQRPDKSAPDFTQADPADRLETLSDILGQQFWEDLAGLAKAEAQNLELDLRALTMKIDTLDVELKSARTAAEELASARPALARAEAERRLAADEETAAQQALAAADAMLQLVADRRAELERVRTRAEAARSAIAEAERVVAAHAPLIAQAADIEALQGSIGDLTAALSEQEELRTRAEDIDRAIAQIEQQRRESEAARAAERATLERTAAELPSRAERLRDLEEQQTERGAALTAVDERIAAAEKVLEEAPEIDEAITSHDAEIREMTARGTKLGQNLEALARADECPTCLQGLAGEHKDHVLENVRAEQATLRERYREVSRLLADLRSRHAALKETRAELERLRRERAAIDAQRARLGAEIEAARVRRDEADAARARLAQTAEAAAEDPRLPALREKRAVIAYDPERVRDLRERLAAHGSAAARAAQLATARAETTAAARAIEERGRELEQAEQRAAEIATALATDAGTDDRETLTARVQSARGRREEAERLEQGLRQKIGAFEGRAEQLPQLLEAMAQQRERLEKAEHRKGIAQELAKACGKKGVPWLIIRSVLPELDAEANEILGLVSDGELALEFRYEDENKSGVAKPTLKISVLKDGNTQPYELCSGGQAFKVTFAMRVALSRLLARRAGTKMQLLFIDEGFGSQDEESRPLFIDAIRSIAPLFAKIVIISHVPEIRDAFGQRVEIVRGPNGAQLQRVV